MTPTLRDRFVFETWIKIFSFHRLILGVGRCNLTRRLELDLINFYPGLIKESCDSFELGGEESNV